MSLAIDSTVKLAGGGVLPRLGLGVYEARGEECVAAIKEALRVGYRHVDSAHYYRNEDLVRQAVKQSTIPRSEVFITTKYMPTHKVHPPDAVYKYLRSSLAKIDGEDGYIDLMLIHAPWGGEEGRANNWAALTRGQKEGWIKDIGVSNYGVKHLESLPGPVPAVNQIELHPWCQQKDIVSYCEKKGIVVQAYSPLVRAEKDKFEDPVIQKLCGKYNKDPAQILIRWSLQKGYVPLPKTVTMSRIKSNADVYDFELDKQDMADLDGLDRGASGAITWNPVDQD